MKIRDINDFVKHKERLEKSIPMLKQMVTDQYHKVVNADEIHICNERDLKKLISLNAQLWKNKGIISVLSQLPKQQSCPTVKQDE